MKYQMVEYQKKINTLRVLRSDLDEKTIAKEVQKIATTTTGTVIGVLRRSIQLAMEDKPMQWEIRG